MEIKDLIRDLIVEDKFNAKYTKRQKSIFCKNMYTKISKFLRQHDEEYRLSMNAKLDNLEELCSKLEYYRENYKQYRQGYDHMLKRQKWSILVEFMHHVLNLIVMVYFYTALYRWITATTPTDQLPKSRQIA